MHIVCDILQFSTVVLLGLLAGALWAEGALLVPYWKTLSAEEFYQLHPQYAPRLFRFFAPITATAPAVALAAALLIAYTQTDTSWLAGITALLANSLPIIYFAYFKKANAAFSRAAFTAQHLPVELNRWQAWHSVRVVVCMLAFLCSIAAL